MLKKFVLPSLMLAIIVIFSGCGEPRGKFTDEQMAMIKYPIVSGLPQATGGFTISVHDQVVTSQEIIETKSADFTELAKKSDSIDSFTLMAKPKMQAVVANSIADLLLYQQAKKSMPTNVDDEMLDKFVNEEINKFISTHSGNYSEAEQAIAEMGMDWKSFRDYQKRMMIVQSYISGQIKKDRPLKHSEIVDYYNSVKEKRFTVKPQMQFRLIDIAFDKVVQPDPNNPQDVEILALQLADEIFAKLVSGADFAELAKQYSNDFAAKDGGLWQVISLGSLAEPYNILEEKAQQLVQAGSFSEPIAAKDHIFIIQLISFTPAQTQSFEQVQGKLEQELKFMQKKRAIDELIIKMIKNVDVAEIDNFVNFCLDEIYNKAVKD